MDRVSDKIGFSMDVESEPYIMSHYIMSHLRKQCGWAPTVVEKAKKLLPLIVHSYLVTHALSSVMITSQSSILHSLFEQQKW